MLEHFLSPDNAKLIREVVEHLSPYKLKLLPVTIFGVLALYLYNRNQHKQPFSVLTPFNIDLGKAKPVTIFFDVTLSSIFGGLLVFLFTEPETLKQALVSGIGMTGILSAYTKGEKEQMAHTRLEKGLSRQSPDIETQNKTIHYARQVCKISLMGTLVGFILTTWFLEAGLILAIIGGGLAIVSFGVATIKEQA